MGTASSTATVKSQWSSEQFSALSGPQPCRCTTGTTTTKSKNWTTQRRRQLRTSIVFSTVYPCLVDDLLSRTLGSPSWEKTSKTTGGTATGTSAALSRNCTTPPEAAPAPVPSGNPLWGSQTPPQTDVVITVVSLRTGLWGPRVRGSLSRRRRHRTDKSSGQQLPRECRPSSDSSRCTCRPLGPPATVTPGWLLASPSCANLTGTKPLHHDTVAGPRRGVVEWLYYSKRIIIDKSADLSDFFFR